MNLKLCINLPQYCAYIVYIIIFSLHILIVTYNSTYGVCYGDCNSEKTRGKFVRLNEGKNRPVLTNFAWASEVG